MNDVNTAYLFCLLDHMRSLRKQPHEPDEDRALLETLSIFDRVAAEQSLTLDMTTMRAGVSDDVFERYLRAVFVEVRRAAAHAHHEAELEVGEEADIEPYASTLRFMVWRIQSLARAFRVAGHLVDLHDFNAMFDDLSPYRSHRGDALQSGGGSPRDVPKVQPR